MNDTNWISLVAQVFSTICAIAALGYTFKNSERQNKISLAARRIKILHLCNIVRDQLDKVWQKHQKQILNPNEIEKIATGWVEGLRSSPQLRRLLPKTEKEIWKSCENMYEYLNPMLSDEFDDAEYYFEKQSVSAIAGELGDLFDSMGAYASSSEGFPDKSQPTFNLHELTMRINQVLVRSEAAIAAMKSEMKF